MFIAKVVDQKVVQIGTVKELFPHTSFGPSGPSEKQLSELQCKVVNYSKTYDVLTEKIVQVPAYYESGKVFAVKAVPLSEEEIAEQKAAAMMSLKQKRNQLIRQSDGYMTVDSTADKKAWGAYRDALRKFPETVVDARLPYEFPQAPV